MNRVWKGIGTALLLLAFLAFLLYFVYVPGYLLNRKPVSLPDGEREEVVVMSANVRYLAPTDVMHKSWYYRARLMREDIELVRPDIIGFQEVTSVHYDYLVHILPDYASDICYRDNSLFSEGCPIFYRTDKYEKINGGTFWLSETPDEMSKSWGSSHYRVACYVILKDKATEKEFVVFNTHLDNKSQEARIEGIRLVTDKIREFGDIPAILMGDLNATPSSETILSTKTDFDDAHDIATISDEGATYHNYGKEPDRERIDYILLSKGKFTVSEYRIVDNGRSGQYSSDHAPIYVKIRF